MNYWKKRRLNICVAGAALLQSTTPIFATFDETENFNEAEIIPATYTFGIWGVITTLAFLYAVYQMLPNRKNEALHRRLGSALLVVYLLFSAWLFAADRQWLIVTVLIFIAMFALLTIVFQEILSVQRELTLFEKIALEVEIALYTGWSTIAIFANTAACLKGYGFLVSNSSVGTIIQVIILMAAYQ